MSVGVVRWYPVHTRPKMEWDAARHLKRQGYITYFLFERMWRYQGRGQWKRRVQCEAPLFSRYIFVCLSKPSQSLYDVNETWGVSTVLYCNGEPAEIPHPVMDAIMARGDSDGLVGVTDKTKPTHNFTGKVGDRFQFDQEHIFRDYIGVIESLADLDRKGEIRAYVEGLKASLLTVPVKSVGEILKEAS